MNKAITTITLDTPLKRGEQTIESFEIRKPTSGDLRGVSLAELLQLQVTALAKVLPRITTPTLTEQDIYRLDPADLIDAATEVTSFLLKKAQRQELESLSV